ncbi:PspA/IM30 family protein [Saccharibacillus sp. JS10]|uniref:PspA/IM30 family protein n=1 Tax=Saccharibacillus sp. JS10 TaxID=2950552 RepID=UPI00210C6520|nr:PspA/IM30 family protein [Saccharibacillus sp. JS10]MCQ4088515.1 PspA/IM30 family protein [Saccharibacillus sp. JS10]
MSMFKRMRDITLATLNDKLEESQDPVRIIDQFLVETRQEIGEVQRLYDQCAHHSKQLRQQVDHATSMREKREEQAMLALKADEESIAKLALQEKMLYEEKERQYLELWEQSQDTLKELGEQLNVLRNEYQTVYNKRQYYYARMETLRLQQRLNRRSGGYNSDVPKMFDRLDDQMSSIEYETYSLRDIRKLGQEASQQIGEVGNLLEEEMARLKDKLKRGEGKE